nr:YxeA family protein [Clostridioides sp.]
MKRIFCILTIILLLALGGGWYFLFSDHGLYATTDYYVKITTEPKLNKEYYNYDVTAYDKDSKPRELILSSGDKMEKNQYYLIHWEEKRQIISSKEKLSKEKIDNSLLEKLDSHDSQ